MAVKINVPIVRDPGDQFQRSVKQAFESVASTEITQGVLLTGVALATTSTRVPHGLGRPYRGFLVVDSTAAVTVYRDPAFRDGADKFLPLIASVATTVALWVF